MRNIAFVITLYMLSMFSIHAQHSYYKLDRETNSLQQIPETSELRDFLFEMPNQHILANRELFIATSLDDKAPLALIVLNYNEIQKDIKNELQKIKGAKYLIFKEFTEYNSISQVNFKEFENLEYLVINTFEDFSEQEFAEKLIRLNIVETLHILVIKSKPQ